MKGAHSISTRRAYGVQRVCRVWQCARSSVYARRQATTSPTPCRRRGPVGAAPDDVLVGHIRRVLEASPFHGEGYRKAWAKLRVEGIRTPSQGVLREHLGRRYASVVAPTGSCARPFPSAPASRHCPWPGGLCRLSPVPAGRWPFPTLSLQSVRRPLGPIPRRVSWMPVPTPSPRTSASRHGKYVRHAKCYPALQLCRAPFSRLQSFDYLQAPTLARPPGCTHRSISSMPSSRAVYTTHRPGGYPYRDVVSLHV